MVEVVMIPVEARNPGTPFVLLAMGGNIGDTMKYVQNALEMLNKGGFSVDAVSRPYINPAVGCEEGASDFTNLAVRGRWQGTPEELLALVQNIEVLQGRPENHPHWHSRTLDIDIIFCNGESRTRPELTIPHPRWRERDFVIIPMRDVLTKDEIKKVFA